MRHNPARGIMNGLMSERGVESVAAHEIRKGRHADAIGGRVVISAVAALGKRNAVAGKGCLQFRIALVAILHFDARNGIFRHV